MSVSPPLNLELPWGATHPAAYGIQGPERIQTRQASFHWSNSIDFVYDAASQLTSAGDSKGTLAYVYDALGRVTSDTQTITGLTPSVVMASAYDANSNRTQFKATIGGTADYKNDYLFDNLSRETRVTQQGQSGGNAVAGSGKGTGKAPVKAG